MKPSIIVYAITFFLSITALAEQTKVDHPVFGRLGAKSMSLTNDKTYDWMDTKKTSLPNLVINLKQDLSIDPLQTNRFEKKYFSRVLYIGNGISANSIIDPSNPSKLAQDLRQIISESVASEYNSFHNKTKYFLTSPVADHCILDLSDDDNKASETIQLGIAGDSVEVDTVKGFRFVDKNTGSISTIIEGNIEINSDYRWTTNFHCYLSSSKKSSAEDIVVKLNNIFGALATINSVR